MRLIIIGAAIIALMLLARPTVFYAQGEISAAASPMAYLPLIVGQPAAPPTLAPTSTPTSTPIPVPTNTPTLPPPSFTTCAANPSSALNYPVRIVTVFKDANPEVVRLQNVSAFPVSLDGWTMCSITGNQTHDGIGGTLAPGETRDFAHTGGFIWNNSSSDPGALYDDQGRLIAYWPN